MRNLVGWRIGVVMVLAAAGCAGSHADAQAKASNGYRLVQRDAAGGRTVTVVSELGTRQRQLRRKGRRWRLVGGSIVRYRDRSVFLLEAPSREFLRRSLSERLAEAERDLKALRSSSASERFPTPTGRPKRVSIIASPVRFRRRVAGLKAQGLRVRTGHTVERFWYAQKLPSPPAAVRDDLAKLGEMTVAQGDSAAARLSDQTLLRRERRRGRRWVPVFDTLRARRLRVTPRAFAPPSGYRAAYRSPARTSKVPPGLFQPQGGPIANDPSVFAIYWGSPFVASSFGTTMDSFLRSFMNPGSPYRSTGPE